MEDETVGVAIKEFVGRKGYEKNVVVTISHNEQKDVLLNGKCLRHSMSRIQREDHIIGTYEITKTFFYALIIKYIS